MILEVKDLSISYNTKDGFVKAVNSVSLDLKGGDRFGIVGESGCGKSTIVRSILRILPENANVQGCIIFRGKNILPMSEREINEIRWRDISIIPQSAMNALNPVYRVGSQIVESVMAHTSMTRSEALERAEETFEIVGISKKRINEFPHEFSGGMRQRVMIAMAIVLNPTLILVDEPTTALDVIIQEQILSKMVEMIRQRNSSMIFITHDVAVIAQTCDKLAVMYAGEFVEIGKTTNLFKNAYHPYTLGLINAFPDVSQKKSLISIPGFPPDLLYPLNGCCFEERCPFREEICCSIKPEASEVDKGHSVRCHLIDKVKMFREEAKKEETWRKKD